MAEDAVNCAINLANLPEKACVTKTTKIHGAVENSNIQDDLSIYGADAEEIRKLMDDNPFPAEKLHTSYHIE